MALENRDRPFAWRHRSTMFYPTLIVPLWFCWQAMQHRGSCRRVLGAKGDGIGLERQGEAGMVANLVFLALALGQFRNEELPDAGLVSQPHRVAPAVPDIEVADDADVMRIWCPDDEAGADDIAMLDDERAEDIVEIRGSDVVDGGEIVDGEHRSKRIGIPLGPGFARPGDFQLVIGPVHRGDAATEKSGGIDELQVAEDIAPLDGEGAHRGRTGQHGPYLVEIMADAVRPEHGERVAVGCCDDRGDRAGMDGEGRFLGALARGFAL